MDRQDTATALRDRSIDAYQRDHRFRAMINHIVHTVMENRGIDYSSEGVWRGRDVAVFAEDVAAQVLKMVYEEDAELQRLTQERDAFKAHALKFVELALPQPFIKAADISTPPPTPLVR